MDKTIQRRYVMLMMVFLIAVGAIIITLFDTQIVKGEAYFEEGLSGKTRTIATTGMRGRILDNNGLPLAYDELSYNIAFQRKSNASSQYENYTSIINQIISIVEKNGGKTIDTFVVRKNALGEWEYNWGDISAEAKAKRTQNWRKNMVISQASDTPEKVYLALRTRYKVPEVVSYERAIKILSVWQEVQLSSYMAYLPVIVAGNVSIDTVAEIEMRQNQLEGVAVQQGYSRVYPRADMAAHIIGYTGKMYDDETIENYERIGYTRNDYIGITGIEASMEEDLTSNISYRKGSQTVEINSLSKIVRRISEKLPKNGNDVMLTLDSNLQTMADHALQLNIETIRAEQTQLYLAKKAEYDQLVADRGGIPIAYAQTGALVVMEVNTGNILAQSSYPSYDNNLFVNGISQADYSALISDTRNPLFNNAITSKGTPGSIFKMVTGLGSLMEGVITPEETIDDEGEYRKYVSSYAKGPRCWIGAGYAAHSHQDIVRALSNSCNYYFYEASSRLGIEKLNKWADAFGLTVPTGIQIAGEQAGQIGNQTVLYDANKSIANQKTSKPYLVQKLVREYILGVGGTMGVMYDKEALNTAIEKMMQYYMLNNSAAEEIRRILTSEIGIPNLIVANENMVADISSMLVELRWDPSQTIVSGIGQSLTLLTPIAVARYVSALVNGGIVYEANIIEKVLDEKGAVVRETQPKIYNELHADEAYMMLIKEGMREVVDEIAGGTARDYFKDYKYKNSIGGKTGSAQVSKIDLETNAWFVAFAPYDNPEIAVVVYIPHGYSGGRATLAAKEVIEYYLDAKQNKNDAVLPNNQLLE